MSNINVTSRLAKLCQPIIDTIDIDNGKKLDVSALPDELKIVVAKIDIVNEQLVAANLQVESLQAYYQHLISELSKGLAGLLNKTDSQE